MVSSLFFITDQLIVSEVSLRFERRQKTRHTSTNMVAFDMIVVRRQTGKHDGLSSLFLARPFSRSKSYDVYAEQRKTEIHRSVEQIVSSLLKKVLG